MSRPLAPLASLAVVTGAASGIGQAFTQALIARSIHVIAIDKDPVTGYAPSAVTPVVLDVRDADGMAELAATYAGHPVQYVFANAGVGAPGAAMKASEQDWQRAWDINVMGSLRTLRNWWPHLVAARGTAVATVSAAALLTYPGASLYRATKSALLSMLESMWYETRESGVRLHALCPGMVQSNILANAAKDLPPAPSDPMTMYLMEAMKKAEPARDFAERVLNGLEFAPFYLFTHPNTIEAMDARLAAVKAGRPPVEFGAMP